MKFGLALASACGGVALLVSSQANATVYIGPVYPAPGLNSFSASGSANTGTRDAKYTNFDLTASSSLYFNIGGVQLSMDGPYDTPGETLSIDSTLSNLATGLVVFTGSTTINDLVVGAHTVYTMFTLHFEDLSGGDLALITNPGIAGGAPVLQVTGDYQVLEAFTASSTLVGGYTAAQTYFDAAHTPQPPDPNTHYYNSSFSGGFYYTPAAVSDVPEPASWAMMLLGFGAVGAAMRRSRRRLPAIAQIA
jgi:hypothetical protein